jgi:hypothetical protein
MKLEFRSGSTCILTGPLGKMKDQDLLISCASELISCADDVQTNKLFNLEALSIEPLL